jgi:hypothetical protein
MRWITLLFVLACAFPLHAEDFQKCRGEGGTTAYRSKGCLSGETLVAVLEPVADPPQAQRRVAAESPSSQSRTAQRSKRSRSNRAYASHSSDKSRSKRSRSRKDPCRSAKKARDDFQRRRGIKITMDELSRWSHRVYDACK